MSQWKFILKKGHSVFVTDLPPSPTPPGKRGGGRGRWLPLGNHWCRALKKKNIRSNFRLYFQTSLYNPNSRFCIASLLKAVNYLLLFFDLIFHMMYSLCYYDALKIILTLFSSVLNVTETVVTLKYRRRICHTRSMMVLVLKGGSSNALKDIEVSLG